MAVLLSHTRPFGQLKCQAQSWKRTTVASLQRQWVKFSFRGQNFVLPPFSIFFVQTPAILARASAWLSLCSSHALTHDHIPKDTSMFAKIFKMDTNRMFSSAGLSFTITTALFKVDLCAQNFARPPMFCFTSLRPRRASTTKPSVTSPHSSPSSFLRLVPPFIRNPPRP